MAKFLLVMSLEPGHVLPTLNMSSELMRRGHKVTYLCRDRMAKELEAQGFATIGLCREAKLSGVERSLYKASASADSFYAALASVARSDSSLHLILMSEIIKARNLLKANVVVLDAIKDWRGELCKALEEHVRVAQLCVHLRALDELKRTRASDTVGILCPRELETEDNYQQCALYGETGYIPKEITRPEKWVRTSGRRPIVYVSLGSQWSEYEGWRDFIVTLAKTARRTPDIYYVFNYRRGMTVAELKNVNNIGVLRDVPQQEILGSASAMVMHGGLGSIKDCVYAETPMIIIPQKWDQPENARRVAAHGMGINLGKLPSSNDLAESVRQVQEDVHFVKALGQMKRAFMRTDQRKEIADWCETYVS